MDDNKLDIYEIMRCKAHTSPTRHRLKVLGNRVLDGLFVAFGICALLILLGWMQERDETYAAPTTTCSPKGLL